MFKREIKPLAEGMAESISKSINRLQHIEEKASRPADSAEGDVKPQDISGEEEVKADGSAAKAPARKGDKAVSESYNESSCVGEMKQLHASSCSKNEMYEKVSKKYGIDKAKFEELYAQNCSETYKEAIDPVNPKAVKKKFDDRKDKDIDNDGDVDDSDEYLHKRRKAISKALESKKPEASVDESAELEGFDEGNMASAAKELETYARKNGGIDKGDFMKAAVMMKKGQRPQLMKFVDGLDTEPREKILSVMQSHMKEEVELDEAIKTTHVLIDTSKGNKVVAAASSEKGVKQSKASASRPPMSIKDTSVLKIVTLTKPQSQKATEKMIGYPLAKGMDKFPTNTSATQGKRMGEELEEARPPQIQKGKAKGTISATGIRGKGNKKFDVMVGFDNGKFSFRITDESGRFQTVGIKQASKMLGEESVADLTEAKKSDYTIYHKTFSSAVQHAAEVVKKRGYEVDDDSWDRKVAMGPRKPGKGKTNSYTIDLMKGGKPVRNKLQMQVYYDEGRYELNMYIS